MYRYAHTCPPTHYHVMSIPRPLSKQAVLISPSASSPHRCIFSVYACNLQSSKGELVGEADDELSVLSHLGGVELVEGVFGRVDGWVVLAENSLVDEGRWESGLVGRGVVRAGVAALGVSVLGGGVLG